MSINQQVLANHFQLVGKIPNQVKLDHIQSYFLNLVPLLISFNHFDFLLVCADIVKLQLENEIRTELLRNIVEDIQDKERKRIVLRGWRNQLTCIDFVSESVDYDLGN